MDAHLHLQDGRFGPNVAAIMERAQAAGVADLFCNGSGPDDWPQVMALASQYRSVIPFVGLHPWYIEQARDGWANELEAMIKTNRCGVGEIGLDFGKPMDRQLQTEAFEKQLSMACRYVRPVSIHCVKAWAALTVCLRNAGSLPPFMVHAFNGSAEIARELIKLGGYISFNALSFTDNRHAKTKTLLLSLPQDRVLFETESPFGLNAAVNFVHVVTGQVNEPANVPAIVAQAAKLAGRDYEDFAKAVYENGRRFIRLLDEVVL